MPECRDYDAELAYLLDHFKPHNQLLKENLESKLVGDPEPIVSLRWVEKTTEYGELANANS